MTILIIYLTLTSLFIQIFFWIFIFNKIYVRPVNRNIEHEIEHKVSVLICAKNEYNNLKSHLGNILEQNYNNFDLWVANDFSTDKTESMLQAMSKNNSTFHFFNVQKDIPGKKYAIAEALDRITSKWVLFTDADCRPESPYWIEKMLQCAIDENKDIVLGYSPYQSSGTLLDKWVQFENWITAIQYLSFAISGWPYMGVGRNLLIKREAIRKEHLLKHIDLPGGDDDLMINQLAHIGNTTVCMDPDSFVHTFPPKNFSAYINQKRRHYSVSSRYKISHIILLSSFSVSQILFYMGFWFLLILKPWIAVIFLTIRIMLVLPVSLRLSRQLKTKLNPINLIFFDMLLAIFYSIFSFTVLITMKSKWN